MHIWKGPNIRFSIFMRGHAYQLHTSVMVWYQWTKWHTNDEWHFLNQKFNFIFHHRHFPHFTYKNKCYTKQRWKPELSLWDCNTRQNLKMKTDAMDLRHDEKVLSTIQPETEPTTLSSKVFICTSLSLWAEQTICLEEKFCLPYFFTFSVIYPSTLTWRIHQICLYVHVWLVH